MTVTLNFQRYTIATAPTTEANQPGVTKPVVPIPASSSNPMIQGLINLFKNDPNQRRTTKNYNLLLAQVAQARAEDMSRNGYFSHTDKQGFGPNYHIVKKGYPLASFYNRDVVANNVESIAAGYDSPGTCWAAWLNSPGHRRHVLGEIDFYRDQIDFGIGYAPGGQHGHYWVFISAKS